jgi:DNA (cytosine-5)-methyltransferase 1
MSACGDGDDCISTSEAGKFVEKLNEKVINSLPRPGQVEFINGGPPCQVLRASSLSGSFNFM